MAKRADKQIMKTILSAILLLCFTSSVAAQSTEDDLMRYLPPGEARWLEVDQNRYLLLERQSLQAVNRGVVIHLSEWNTHPLSSAVVRPLYQELPTQGWTTFALHPPTTPLHTDMLQFPAVDERYPEPVGDETLTALRTQLRDRLQPLMTELTDYSGFVILVAEGMTAALLTDILRTDLAAGTGLVNPVQPDALVVINPYLPQYSLNQNVATQLASLPLPVLDITTATANSWAIQTQQRRKQFAARDQHISYRQKSLYGEPAPSRLLNQLVGWLRYQGF